MNPADMEAAVRTVPDHEMPAAVPTGSYGLDCLLDGGWPEGCVSEIHGPAMSGKSVLTLASAAGVSQHSPVVLLDLDGSFSPSRAERFGVNLENLIVTQSPALMREYFRHGLGAELAILDGIPSAEDARELGYILADMRCTTLCVTQERERLVSRGKTWVSAGTAAGWISEPSVRIQITPDIDGFKQVEVKINTFRCPAYAPVYFRICDSGIDTAQELLDLGLLIGTIHKREGARYWTMHNTFLGHGAQAARDAIAARQGLAKEIWAELVAQASYSW